MKDFSDSSRTTQGLILVPQGIPSDIRLFENLCLPIAFVIGKRVCQATVKGEKACKKEIFDLQGLCQRKKASLKHRTQIGEELLAEAKDCLDQICTKSSGPYTYETLNDLATHFKHNVVVFSQMIATPKLVLPYNQELGTDWPTIFLEEVQSLNPNSKYQKHLNCLVYPGRHFKKAAICRLCLKLVTRNLHHYFCRRRASCKGCHRRKLHDGDHFSYLMIKEFCASALVGHPCVTFLNDGRGQKCLSCDRLILTDSCMKLHRKNCFGKIFCQDCFKVIFIRKGENAKEKLDSHECGMRYCANCFQKISAKESKYHTCRFSSMKLQKFFNSIAILDFETVTLGKDNLLRDCLANLHFEYGLMGLFSEITFAAEGFHHRDSEVIKKHVLAYDYLPLTIGNAICKRSGLIKPSKRKRCAKKPTLENDPEDAHMQSGSDSENGHFENEHWNLESHIRQTKYETKDLLLLFQSYKDNLKKFDPIAPKELKQRSVYKVLCFIL